MNFTKVTRLGNWFETFKNDYAKWDEYNKELLSRLFSSQAVATEYSQAGGSIRVVSIMNYPSPSDEFERRLKTLISKIKKLESIKERLELIPLASGVQPVMPQASSGVGNRVFIVHGHDEAARGPIARFIEKLGLEAVILHEQASGGRTIIEKLEYYSNVAFAVVLLTPDDVGAAKDLAGNLNSRARQNVILELGYFCRQTWAQKRLCPLQKRR